MKPDYSRLPESLRQGMRLYVEEGVIPGSFLQAVLENNFIDAVMNADPENLDALREIALFVRHELPPRAWGSVAAVQLWASSRPRPSEKSKATVRRPTTRARSG